MPLDVQPLSPTRRVIMVLLMFALLAASLGLANLLIRRQNVVRVSVSVIFAPPAGATSLMPVNVDPVEIFKGALADCRVTTEAGPRRYLAFSFDDPTEGVIGPEDLFARITGDDATKLPAPTKTLLSKHPAIQIEKQYGLIRTSAETTPAAPSSAFAIMRYATVEGRIIAICFSGPGVPAESDRQAFEDYCSYSVKILTGPARPNLRRK